MAITPFMNLDLPTVSVTLGPEWATALNDALEVIDSHDHSSDKGVKVPTAGLDINEDLDFNNVRLFGLKAAKLQEQMVSLTGASNVLSLFSLGGNLYFTSGAGVAVQITNGNNIVAPITSLQLIDYTPVATNRIIDPASNEVLLAVDTTAARSITLPSAAAVTTGRVYMIKDVSGLSETNNITVLPNGADTIDGAASQTVRSNFANVFYVTDGINKWYTI
jgi:hypothetical protein